MSAPISPVSVTPIPIPTTPPNLSFPRILVTLSCDAADPILNLSPFSGMLIDREFPSLSSLSLISRLLSPALMLIPILISAIFGRFPPRESPARTESIAILGLRIISSFVIIKRNRGASVAITKSTAAFSGLLFSNSLLAVGIVAF